MTTRTLNALKKSIKHWSRLLSGRTLPAEAPYSEDCALCGLFIKLDCRGCPVSEKTGEIGCIGSPYFRAQDAWGDNGPSSTQFKRAAEKELAFLESLLPK